MTHFMILLDHKCRISERQNYARQRLDSRPESASPPPPSLILSARVIRYVCSVGDTLSSGHAIME
jgi:hypothetical protein